VIDCVTRGVKSEEGTGCDGDDTKKHFVDKTMPIKRVKLPTEF
jgi:hypothetical protein